MLEFWLTYCRFAFFHSFLGCAEETCVFVRLSGISPFHGDSDQETLGNVMQAKWKFDQKAFQNISADARDFIYKLLVLEPQ